MNPIRLNRTISSIIGSTIKDYRFITIINRSNPINIITNSINNPLLTINVRTMANKNQVSKDKLNMKKKKEKSTAAASAAATKGNKGLSELNPSSLTLIEGLDSKLIGIIAKFQLELSEIKIGRAIPSQLDSLIIDIPGDNKYPLKQLSTITSRSSHILLLTVFDSAYIKPIEKSLRLLAEQNEWTIQIESNNILTVTFPKSNKSSRDELIKSLSRRTEDIRTALRTARQNYLHQFKSLSEDLSDTERTVVKNRIQALVDNSIDNVNNLFKDKEKELNTI